MNIHIKMSMIVVILSNMAACGGSGSISYDYTTGTTSSEGNADQAISSSVTFSQPYTSLSGTSLASANALNNLYGGGDLIATTDTNARIAWQRGWTGKNVKVGIADEFDSNGQIDTHGDWVALITETVAPEANFANIDTEGGVKQMSRDQAFQYFENNGYHIINGTWVSNKFDLGTGVEDINFQNKVNALINSFDQEAENNSQALVIYPAGNTGMQCPGKRSEDCTLEQARINALRASGKIAGEKIIFVGALKDGSDTLNNYSIIAGDLMNDFIVAHDDVIIEGDEGGTSTAAPRAVGAAAIVRQKFPNLTSQQLKQVLLQTAIDLGAPGVDEVYGYGKLNIPGALSPYGIVVPKD